MDPVEIVKTSAASYIQHPTKMNYSSAENQSSTVDGQELDAVRRHICQILGFDYGIIDVLRPGELVNLLIFTGDESEQILTYPLNELEDENQEILSQPNSQIARHVVSNIQPYIGTCHTKRRERKKEEAVNFPYIIMPICQRSEDNKQLLKGIMRLVSLNPEHKSDNNDLQTLQIVSQHIASRLPSLSLQALEGKGAKANELELKHVLIAHTNRAVRRRFSRLLSASYKVFECDNTQNCLELLKSTPVDILVIDNQLMHPSGQPLYRVLKQTNDTKHIPCLLVTEEDDSTRKIEGLNFGADDCLDINCMEAELPARVKTLIRAKKNERELATQLKLLEDYTKRLEQVSEKERLANLQISENNEQLQQITRELTEKRHEAEIRRNQDNLLHRISNILRQSFDINTNIRAMLEHLSGWFQLDCCFAVLPDQENPEDSVRQEYFSSSNYGLKDSQRDLDIFEIFKSNFSLQDDLFVNDVKRDKRIEPFRNNVLRHYHMYSLFYLPVTYEGKLQGILGGHKCESEHFWSLDNQNFLRQVADQVATALTNAHLYKRLERQATTDGLTGLINHRTGQEKLSDQLRMAERYQRNLSVIMMDVDHFKSINDTYGHPVGDTVLKTVASVIKRGCRDVDIPVRYGGEEFLIVLPEVNKEGALIVADRLQKALSKELIENEGVQLTVTGSLGVACFPDDANNQEQLLELADRALYLSKRLGRNQVHSASELAFQEFNHQLDQISDEQYAAATEEHPPSTVAQPSSQITNIQQAPISPPQETITKESEPSQVSDVVDTVKKMAATLYARSHYNKIHHLETARFSEMVAKVLGLPVKEIEQIRVASLLHDVGLLHVSDDILNKKGQVTAEELRILMQHPVLGAEMLQHIPALKEICNILECHHECWDGTGYPKGLKGEEIPLAARIVGIVGAYHAMISDRPYRPAMNAENAKRVLKTQAGFQYDPFLVDIFLACLIEMDLPN